MEKIEDLELSELQELALRHQTVLPRKSLEEKCMIVKAYLSNHVPITQLSKEFGIPRVTIWRWIRTFADGKVPKGKSNGTPIVKSNPPAMPKKKQNVEESAAEELARLRAENKRLSEALKMAGWMNYNRLYWDATLTKTWKQGRWVAKLKGYDLLGQVSQWQYYVSSQGRTEYRMNNMRRYVLLSLAYRFSLTPKKN